MGAKQFRDLPIGAVFVMDRGIETGLSFGLNEPGFRRYVKIGVRKYRAVANATPTYTVGTVHAKVWQPNAQPGEYSPMAGLRVWFDEYNRLADELRIFREVGGTDINYPERLRHARDIAAARLAGYAGQVFPNQTDTEWLAEFFEFEVCGECGWGVDRHAVGPDPLGNRHAYCVDPIPNEFSDLAAVAELTRRMAISTSQEISTSD
jgi:hypothetical protein